MTGQVTEKNVVLKTLRKTANIHVVSVNTTVTDTNFSHMPPASGLRYYLK